MLTTTGLAPGAMVHGAPELSEPELRAIVEPRPMTGPAGHVPRPGRRVRPALGRGRRHVSVEHAWLADEAAIEALAASGAWLVPTLVVTDVNRTLPGLTPVQRERQDLIERSHRASTETADQAGRSDRDRHRHGRGRRDVGHGVAGDRPARRPRGAGDGRDPGRDVVRGAAARHRCGVGSVEVGKLADLVLVDGDPIVDLGVLARPVGVWQGGQPVSA